LSRRVRLLRMCARRCMPMVYDVLLRLILFSVCLVLAGC